MIDCSSMSVLLMMFVGVMFSVNMMLSLIRYCPTSNSLSCFLSFLIVVNPVMVGVLDVCLLAFVSCIVMMSAL